MDDWKSCVKPFDEQVWWWSGHLTLSGRSENFKWHLGSNSAVSFQERERRRTMGQAEGLMKEISQGHNASNYSYCCQAVGSSGLTEASPLTWDTNQPHQRPELQQPNKAMSWLLSNWENTCKPKWAPGNWAAIRRRLFSLAPFNSQRKLIQLQANQTGFTGNLGSIGKQGETMCGGATWGDVPEYRIDRTWNNDVSALLP